MTAVDDSLSISECRNSAVIYYNCLQCHEFWFYFQKWKHGIKFPGNILTDQIKTTSLSEVKTAAEYDLNDSTDTVDIQ